MTSQPQAELAQLQTSILEYPFNSRTWRALYQQLSASGDTKTMLFIDSVSRLSGADEAQVLESGKDVSAR